MNSSFIYRSFTFQRSLENSELPVIGGHKPDHTPDDGYFLSTILAIVVDLRLVGWIGGVRRQLEAVC